MAAKMVRSEQISEFEGYWIHSDGMIIERKSKTTLRPYSSGVLSLRTVEGRRKTASVHRLVAEAFVPNPNKYKFVKFIDGNPENRAADNLEWIKGVRAPSELTEDIIMMYRTGSSSVEIAYFFGKTPQYVNRILKEERARGQ